MSPIDRALALHQAGDLAAAETIYRSILAREPTQFDACHMLGVICAQREHYAHAEQLMARAMATEPDDVACLHNYANVLVQLGRLEEALEVLDRAVAHAADDAALLSDRGRTLKALARYDEAIAAFESALTIQTTDADAHLDLAVCRLLNGDFAAGWREYEWRWRVAGRPMPRPVLPGPPWLGHTDIAGQTILIHAEQGLGDAIQFSRYATLLAARGAEVVLQVRPELAELLAGLEGVARILVVDEPPPPGIHRHCPLMSLPLAFGTRLHTIPAAPAYVRPSADGVKAWAERLGPKRRPRIGIVWSGSATNANEANRAIGLARLLPLRSLDVDLIGLQREVRPEDRAILAGHPDIRHFDAGFADTAALIGLLDLVVSVDTSLAHLAGAVGAPTFLLLSHVPDWRWLRARDDSPWYPSMRLFRQPARGDWESVVGRVLEACRARFAPT